MAIVEDAAIRAPPEEEPIFGQEEDGVFVGGGGGSGKNTKSKDKAAVEEQQQAPSGGLCKDRNCCPFADLDFGISLEVLIVIFTCVVCFVSLWSVKSVWISRMWATRGEGHSVAKFVVLLFFFYVPSFVLWFKDVMTFGEIHITKCGRVWIKNAWQAIRHSPLYITMKQLQIFAKIIYAPLATFLAAKVWDFVWITFVCKSLNDRSCTKTWIGLMLYNIRHEVCHDGNASYAMCDKLIAYLPIIVLTLVTVTMGNVIQNRINEGYRALGRAAEADAQSNPEDEWVTSSESSGTSLSLYNEEDSDENELKDGVAPSKNVQGVSSATQTAAETT